MLALVCLLQAVQTFHAAGSYQSCQVRGTLSLG